MGKRGRARAEWRSRPALPLAGLLAASALAVGVGTAGAGALGTTFVSYGETPDGLPAIIVIAGPTTDLTIEEVDGELEITDERNDVVAQEPCRQITPNKVRCPLTFQGREIRATHLFLSDEDDELGLGDQKLSQHEIFVNGGDGNDRLIERSCGTCEYGKASAAESRAGSGARDRPDFFIGGSGKDTIKATAGKDNIRGGGGNDTLSGGEAADTINGGGGNDRCAGGPGKDKIRQCE
jgi:hypothetical protein